MTELPPLPLEQRHEWWKRRGGRELREILYWRWDPIGIAGAALPYNGDEYDSYAGPIVNLLHTGADDREVARHLEDVEPGGLTVSSDHHRETADLITAWYGMSIRLWREEGR